MQIGRPQEGEYAPYYGKYVKLVETQDVMQALEIQLPQSLALYREFSESESLLRPAERWNLRQVLGHVIDTERMFGYRALRFARGDETPLEGFDQDQFMKDAGFSERPWEELLDEYEVVRRSTLAMVRGFNAEAWQRSGVASDNHVSVRALLFIIAGHDLHHRQIVERDYRPLRG